MTNPAGAFAKALFVPIAKMYVNYVVGLANSVAEKREARGFQPYAGGPVFHEYC
jgi:hypothetical protein